MLLACWRMYPRLVTGRYRGMLCLCDVQVKNSSAYSQFYYVGNRLEGHRLGTMPPLDPR